MPRINPETPLVKRIQVAASSIGCRLFRNNVGSLKDRNGTWVTYGLCTGSSDLIGWIPVKVTQEMVGKTISIFLALEVKTPTGKLTAEQQNFLSIVTQAGGISFVATSEEEATRILKGHYGKNY